jgi:hypothetical protein
MSPAAPPPQPEYADASLAGKLIIEGDGGRWLWNGETWLLVDPASTFEVTVRADQQLIDVLDYAIGVSRSPHVESEAIAEVVRRGAGSRVVLTTAKEALPVAANEVIIAANRLLEQAIEQLDP